MIHTDSICSLWMRSDLNFFLSLKSREQRHTLIIYLFVWILCCLFYRMVLVSREKKKKNVGCELTGHVLLLTVMQRAFQCYTIYKLLIQTFKIFMTYGYAWNALKRGTMFLSVTYMKCLSLSMIHVIHFFRSNILHINYNEVYNLLSTQNCNGRPTYCSATSLALVYWTCSVFDSYLINQNRKWHYVNLDTNNW